MVKNLGYTKNCVGEKMVLIPVNYPVSPGGVVKYPSSKDLGTLLNAGMNNKNPLYRCICLS